MPQSSAELAKQFGGSPSSALAAQFGGKPATSVPSPVKTEDAAPRTWLDDVKDFAVGVWQKQPIHPIDIAKGTIDAANHPIETVKGIVTSQGVPLSRAEAAFKRGDYAAGVTDVINWLLPVIGPQISESQDRLRKGEVSPAGFIGESVGIATQVALPEVARRAPDMRVPPAITNRNPVERAAVEFGQRAGVPIDAATATGNRVVRGAQNISDRTLGGAVIGERARVAQEAGLTRAADNLASRTGVGPTLPEQAGQGVRSAIQSRAAALHAEADAAYDALRALEAKRGEQVQVTPATTRQSAILDASGQPMTSAVPAKTETMLAVDVAPTKAAMRGIYDSLKRESELVPLMGDKARALTALDRLMSAPDLAPLSIADGALSGLKDLARVDESFRRTSGQGIAAEAVKNLNASVVKTAAKAGPDVVTALMKGRAATTNKYKAIDVLNRLKDEPVGAFKQATVNQDAAISLLRDIKREAPKELASIGRAYLDDVFSTATADGGFAKAQGLHAKWQKLGPETKALLFPDATLRSDLDKFFLLAKKIQDNPNPSGTSYVTGIGVQGGLLVTEPMTGVAVTLSGAALSKLLHSPAGVRALSRGFSVPVASKGQAASTWAMLQSAAKAEGVPLVPVTAESEGTPTARGAQ